MCKQFAQRGGGVYSPVDQGHQKAHLGGGFEVRRPKPWQVLCAVAGHQKAAAACDSHTLASPPSSEAQSPYIRQVKQQLKKLCQAVKSIRANGHALLLDAPGIQVVGSWHMRTGVDMYTQDYTGQLLVSIGKPSGYYTSSALAFVETVN